MNKEKFILGTVQFGLAYGINNALGQPTEADVFDILDFAWEQGIRHLDSAEGYGTAQKTVGSYIRSSGRKFQVNSKFRVAESLDQQLDHTLGELNLDRIHTYFYHRFHELQSEPGSMKELVRLKSKGRIEKTGVSVYENNELEACVRHEDVDVIQLPFNLLDNSSKRKDLIDEAKSRGKSIQVRSVFLQGLFFRDPESFPVYLDPLKKYVGKIRQLSEQFQLPVHDLALLYPLAEKGIDQVIIGVDSKKQLEANVSLRADQLDPQLKAAIDEIDVQEEHLLYPYNWK